MEDFKDRLKELIEESGLTLRQLSSKIQISTSQLSRYLNGTIPTLTVAVKIANYFNCSLDFLFGISEKLNGNFKETFDIEKFIDRYQDLLIKSNTTHYKFCQKYTLSESSLRHWKSGNIPSLENLIFIANTLLSSLDYLVGRKDKE